jgi:hypothetical protein
MNKTYYYILKNTQTKVEEIEVLDYEIGGKGELIFFNDGIYEVIDVIKETECD